MIKFKALLLILVTVFVAPNDGHNPNIEGKWTMCERGTDDSTIISNVCTDIIFSNDGAGVIEYPGKKSNFQWKFDDETIHFTFKSEQDQKDFLTNSSRLKYKIYKEKEFEYFQLMEPDNDYWYLLLRSNK